LTAILQLMSRCPSKMYIDLSRHRNGSTTRLWLVYPERLRLRRGIQIVNGLWELTVKKRKGDMGRRERATF